MSKHRPPITVICRNPACRRTFTVLSCRRFRRFCCKSCAGFGVRGGRRLSQENVELLTVPQAAARLGVPEHTVRYYIKCGELIPLGGKDPHRSTLLSLAEVEALAGRENRHRLPSRKYWDRLGQDLLTREQAAQLLGISALTIKQYHQKLGRLQRANPEDRGLAAVYRREDVDALRQHLMHAEGGVLDQRRARREAIEAAGERECLGCHRALPLSEFYETATRNSIAGRSARCKKCDSEQSKAKRRENPELFRERERAKTRVSFRVFPANRCRALLVAIEDGKRSPITGRAGFSIALGTNGSMRAARLDRPLERGETPLVRYERSVVVKGWVIQLPPICNPLAREVTAYCQQREEKGADKR